MSGKDTTVEIESKSLVAAGWRSEWRLIASSHKETFRVTEVQNWIVVMFAQP